MSDWRDTLIRQFSSFETVGALAAAGLLAFAYSVLPKEQRKSLKAPTALLIGYSVLEFAHRWLTSGARVNDTLSLISLLLLLVALTRSAFLVFVDWLIGHRLGRPLPRIFRDILQGLLFLGIALVLFHSMGVELGSLLTTSAILTAVIGLSLQESLGNLVAGLAVRAEHPFEVGDWVEFGDGQRVIGHVIEINWRATKLRTNDLVDIVVPNGLIAKSTIQNYSRPSHVTRRTVAFQGPYDVPPERVKHAVLPALRGVPSVAASPAPKIWISNFGSSGIDYLAVYFLTNFSARSDVESDVRARIWYALNRAKISMPYPVCDVRMTPEEATQPALDFGMPPEVRNQLLSEVSMFSEMPSAIREQLAIASKPVLFATGESIVREGEAGYDLFVVADGEVTVITHSNTGERLTLAGLMRGQVFGELSLVTGVRGATVVAARETQLLQIGHDDFRRIVTQVPGLGESLLTRVVERQEQMERGDDSMLHTVTENGALRGALFDKIRRFFAT